MKRSYRGKRYPKRRNAQNRRFQAKHKTKHGVHRPGISWKAGACMLGIAICLAASLHAQKQDDSAWPLPQKGDPNSCTIRVYLAEQECIQEMPLEEYLYGVVAAEMPAAYESQALMAQAVAARTYAWRKKQTGGCARTGADICTDSSCCQAYRTQEQRAQGWGSSAETYEQKLRNAVDTTAGEILTYEGQPITAVFHAISGGHTEDVQAVWGGDLPYLKGVESEGEEFATKYASTVSVEGTEFIRKIQALEPSIGQLQLPDCLGKIVRTQNDRVDTMTVGGIAFSGAEIRTAFGLNSTNFTVTYQSGCVVFSVKGYGHGVGMSQAGANAMAQNGADYREILTHYYTGVEIQQLEE